MTHLRNAKVVGYLDACRRLILRHAECFRCPDDLGRRTRVVARVAEEIEIGFVEPQMHHS